MNHFAGTAAAAAVLAAGATLLGPIAPASAEPVDGYVYASGEWLTNGCPETNTGDPLAERHFTNLTGRRTISNAETVTWEDGGGATEVVGDFATTTTAIAKARRRALDELRVRGRTTVRLDNATSFDCGVKLWAVSQTATEVRVRRKGKIRIAWDHGPGNLTDVVLSKPGGGTLVNRDPDRRRGSITVAVAPGRYHFYLRYHTGVVESSVTPGTAKEKSSAYVVDVTYRR